MKNCLIRPSRRKHRFKAEISSLLKHRMQFALSNQHRGDLRNHTQRIAFIKPLRNHVKALRTPHRRRAAILIDSSCQDGCKQVRIFAVQRVNSATSKLLEPTTYFPCTVEDPLLRNDGLHQRLRFSLTRANVVGNNHSSIWGFRSSTKLSSN